MKFAIVVGHSAKSQGAANKEFNITEFEYNNILADIICLNLKIQNKTEYKKFNRISYTTLPEEINSYNPDITISLHCNAFNSNANGSEFLYYHSSIESKILASLIESFISTMQLFKNRGIKPINDRDRGSHLLKNVKSPCVLCETFFIDEERDIITGIDHIGLIAERYCNAILKYGEK